MLFSTIIVYFLKYDKLKKNTQICHIFLNVMFRHVKRKCKEIFITITAQHFSKILCRYM